MVAVSNCPPPPNADDLSTHLPYLVPSSQDSGRARYLVATVYNYILTSIIVVLMGGSQFDLG